MPPRALRTALVMASAVVVAACESASTGEITNAIAAQPGFVPGVPPGFQCPLIPNGFDPAGSIYRLDKSGSYYRVKDYSADPQLGAGGGIKRDVKIANYVLTDKQLSNAGLSFEVLKNALPGLSASGSGDFKKEVAVSITVEDMMGEVIDDVTADRILERFKADVKPQPGSKYYLVRETVRAGSVSYSLKREDLARLGGEAQIQKLAQAKSNVTFRDNAGLFEIKQNFAPDRIAVCIKPAEIVVETTRGTGTVTVALKSPEDTAMAPIKRVGAAQ